MITLETVVQRSAEMLASEVGDELVMMDMENGNYVSLNKIGRVIWEQIEQPVLVGDVVQHLLTRFNVEPAVCTEDTLAYLQSMHAQNAISIK